MDYETAVKKYTELRDKNAQIQADADKAIAENKEKMEKLGTWMQLKAEKDGLESVKTKFGTVFWTVGARCTVANGEAFFDFVQEKKAWELVEKRASKVAVRDWLETHKQLPPGVDYVTYKQINVRAR